MYPGSIDAGWPYPGNITAGAVYMYIAGSIDAGWPYTGNITAGAVHMYIAVGELTPDVYSPEELTAVINVLQTACYGSSTAGVPEDVNGLWMGLKKSASCRGLLSPDCPPSVSLYEEAQRSVLSPLPPQQLMNCGAYRRAAARSRGRLQN